MNCIHSARSLPSGGKKATSVVATRIGASIAIPRRNCLTMPLFDAVMKPGLMIWSRIRAGNSRQNFSYHSGRLHACQLLFKALKRIVELVVIESQQIEQGCMEIADVDRIFDDFVPHLIRLPKSESRLDASTRQPDGEGARIM